MNKPTLLLINNTLPLAILYKKYLENERLIVNHVTTGAEAVDYLRNNVPNVIVLDMELPDMAGMEVLKYISTEKLDTTIIVVTEFGSVELAVESMRYGAFEFLTKPFDKRRFLITISNALEREQLKNMVKSYKRLDQDEFHGMIGSSLPMQTVYQTIENVSGSKATVFITGESGTGKELCAGAIHNLSNRKNNNLMILNCGAIPKSLMESEIFGHVKGAFTGATVNREGAAIKADGGTLFLDEICEMDLELQTKLLRFIQSGTFQPVGSNETVKVDIRFVCATNRDPQQMVEEGTFREDLFYRLNVIPIHLPALRDRGDDCLQIARMLLEEIDAEEGKSFKGFDPEVEKLILFHKWPGNVRQLQNVIRNVVVLNSGDMVTMDMLPSPFDEIAAGKRKYYEHLALEKKQNPRPSKSIDPYLNILSRANLFNEQNPAFKDSGRTSPIANDFTGEVVQRADVELKDETPVVSPPKKRVISPLWCREKEIIEEAIEYFGGNVPRAAASLEISPSTIYRKMKTWNRNEN